MTQVEAPVSKTHHLSDSLDDVNKADMKCKEDMTDANLRRTDVLCTGEGLI